MKFNKFSTIYIILFCSLMSINSYCQSDCIIGPLENEVKETDYIFVFEVDSLIFDSLDIEILDVIGDSKSKIAKGRILKILKQPYYDNTTYNYIIVDSGSGYWFREKYRYLLFLNKNGEDFSIKPCSYSEFIDDSKDFRKFFNKVYRCLKNHTYKSILK